MIRYMTLGWGQCVRTAAGIAYSGLKPKIRGSNVAYKYLSLPPPTFRVARRCVSGSVKLHKAAVQEDATNKSSGSDSNKGETTFVEGVRSGAEPRKHLEQFFQNYPTFQYNPAKPYIKEFYRMVGEFKQDIPDKKEFKSKCKEARSGLRVAMFLEFSEIYGANGRDMNVWRNLFDALDLADVPKTPKACRELIRTIYINICDLVDKPVIHAKIIHFESEELLRKYSRKHKKIFPSSIGEGIRNGLVGPLLRRIGPVDEDFCLLD